MDMMESMKNYEQEEQVSILATLKVVQGRGWSPENSDPFQFHIILGEYIRAKDVEIKSLESNLEKYEDKANQNEKEIKDLKSEQNNEREINDEMEKDLDKKDELIKHLEIELTSKEKTIDDLEVFVRERVDEINHLRENNVSLGEQIAEGIKMEKKIEIQSKVIKELKEASKNNKEINHICKEKGLLEEMENLRQEIEKLENDTKEKETFLENVRRDNAELELKLNILEEENKLLESKTEDSILKGKQNNLTLKDELSHCINSSNVNWFKCEECEKSFDTRNDLKRHKKKTHENVDAMKEWKMKVYEMEGKLSEQKFSLVTDIYNLKEKESKENQICKCRGVCNINHLKQNWKMSHSSEIFSKFKDLCAFSQNNCLIVAGTLKEISCTYCER